MQYFSKKIGRKIITAVIFMAGCTIYSCHSGKNSNTESGTTTTYDTVLLANYRIYLKSLDTLHPTSTTNAAQKYADLFKAASQDTRDSAFSVFKDFYNKVDQTLDNNRDASIIYDSLLTDSNGNFQKLSPRLTAYAQMLKDNGFKVFMSEGNPYIGQDLDFEVKWFYAYLSEPLKQFLTQLNKEEKEGFSEDAGLIITPNQLADRTVWWESFSKKYSQTIVGRPALENWKSYLGTMMIGMDNSPVLETSGSQSLSAYYNAAYTRITTKYPTTQSSKLIEPYFTLLLNKKFDKAQSLIKDYQSQNIIY